MAKINNRVSTLEGIYLWRVKARTVAGAIVLLNITTNEEDPVDAMRQAVKKMGREYPDGWRIVGMKSKGTLDS